MANSWAEFYGAVFPSPDDTTTRSGEFGPTHGVPGSPAAIVGNFVFNNPGDVKQGNQYGANGTEFLGTLNPGVAPSNPILCVVNFNVWGNGVPLPNALIRAKLEEPYSISQAWEVARSISEATTDAQGAATLELVRITEFKTGGTYLIEIWDSNNLKLLSRRVQVPNSDNINSADLIEVTS